MIWETCDCRWDAPPGDNIPPPDECPAHAGMSAEEVAIEAEVAKIRSERENEMRATAQQRVEQRRRQR